MTITTIQNQNKKVYISLFFAKSQAQHLPINHNFTIQQFHHSAISPLSSYSQCNLSKKKLNITTNPPEELTPNLQSLTLAQNFSNKESKLDYEQRVEM